MTTPSVGRVLALRRLAPVLLLALIVGASAGAPVGAQSSAPAGSVVHVGIVRDGPSAIVEDLGEAIQREVLTLTAGEFDVRFEPRHLITAEWTEKSVTAAIDRLFADPEVDLILAQGSLASHVFCCRRSIPKPVIATVVLDPELQELPSTDGRSGVHNLNYLTFPTSIEDDIQLFHEITPFHTVTLVYSRWFAEAVPRLETRFGELIAEQGFDLDLVNADGSIDDLLAALDGAEAVYIAPLVQYSGVERRRLWDGLAARRIPSFSVFGVAEVAEGALAGQRDVTFYERLTRRVALNVQRVLLGEDPGDIPVTLSDRRQLTINMATARATGAWPPWEILSEAVLLNEEPEDLRELALEDAVAEAIGANLDLQASRRAVAAGAQEVARARSIYRPQLAVEALGLRIDEDRASATLSTQAEQTWSASASLSQLVYSEPASANVAIQEHLQGSREQELEQVRLDIARDAAVTYFSVLRAKTFERIRKNDLRVTRSNLDLARVRQSVGSAGPGEVYRWESTLASSRRELVDAQAARYQAEIALNRLLHRPLAERFTTRDVGLDDSGLVTSHGELYRYTGTPLHLEVFSEIAVEAGLDHAPELARLDAAVAAQERAVASARRAYWSPEVALRLALDHQVAESGAGSGGGLALPFPIELPDDTDWSLALRASLPLYEGGSRRAELTQAEESLEQLRLERNATAERLEQLIRSRLHSVRASYAGIKLSAEASVAARKTLELVTDAYSRGAVDILDLLDAQSAALVADLASGDALYRFLIDLVDFERSINQLDFFLGADDYRAWFDRLEEEFRMRDITPRSGRRP